MSLDNLFEKMAEQDVKELRVILRADVQGTLQAGRIAQHPVASIAGGSLGAALPRDVDAHDEGVEEQAHTDRHPDLCHAQHVAHCVIRVGVVHDGISSGIHFQVLQPAPLRLVGVECLRAVAILQVAALLELVIAYLAHIVVAV